MAIRAIGKYISSLGWQLSGNIVRAQGHAVKRRKKEKRKKTLPKCHSTSFCLLAGCCSFLRHDSSFRWRRRSILYAFTLVFCKVFFFQRKMGKKWKHAPFLLLPFFLLQYWGRILYIWGWNIFLWAREAAPCCTLGGLKLNTPLPPPPSLPIHSVAPEIPERKWIHASYSLEHKRVRILEDINIG